MYPYYIIRFLLYNITYMLRDTLTTTGHHKNKKTEHN